jgi:hypothetical protein
MASISLPLRMPRMEMAAPASRAEEPEEGSRLDEGEHVREVYTITSGRFWNCGWSPLPSV